MTPLSFFNPDAPDTLVDVIGDLHQDFTPLIRWATRPRESEDHAMTLVCVGDVGIGYPGHLPALDLLAEACEETGASIFMIRGNHDDPKPFAESLVIGRVHLCPDYTMLRTSVKGRERNILLAGGAITMSHRRKRAEKALYWWEGEEFTLDGWKDLKTHHPYPIHHVVTHSACRDWHHTEGGWPSAQTKPYIAEDPLLLEDLLMESTRHKMLFDRIRRSQVNDLKTWHYGHFHRSYEKTVSGTRFQMLAKKEIAPLNYSVQYTENLVPQNV